MCASLVVGATVGRGGARLEQRLGLCRAVLAVAISVAVIKSRLLQLLLAIGLLLCARAAATVTGRTSAHYRLLAHFAAPVLEPHLRATFVDNFQLLNTNNWCYAAYTLFCIKLLEIAALLLCFGQQT